MIKRNFYVVYKQDKTLNSQWKERLEAILEVIDIPAFAFFIHKGYAAWFIEGTDLHGENLENNIPQEVVLNGYQRQAIIDIFKDIVYAGILTGYTLADFTKKNVMIEGDKAYLIDYDVIIKGKLNSDYIRIFQTMLDYLKLEYKFDGNLKKLYEYLSGLSSR